MQPAECKACTYSITRVEPSLLAEILISRSDPVLYCSGSWSAVNLQRKKRRGVSDKVKAAL